MDVAGSSTPSRGGDGGGLMVAIIQLAIAFGATMGGVVFDLNGYQATFGMSAGLLVIVAVLAIVAHRSAHPDPPRMTRREDVCDLTTLEEVCQ